MLITLKILDFTKITTEKIKNKTSYLSQIQMERISILSIHSFFGVCWNSNYTIYDLTEVQVQKFPFLSLLAYSAH